MIAKAFEKIPLWLKLFISIVFFMMLVPLLSFAQGLPSMIGILLVFVLISFPGPDPARPRLLRFLPWLWALEFVASVILGGGKLFIPEEKIPREFSNVSWVEILTALLAAPLLFRLYFKKSRLLPTALLVIAIVQSVETARRIIEGDFSASVPGKDWLEELNLILTAGVGFIIWIYAKLKWGNFEKEKTSDVPNF